MENLAEQFEKYQLYRRILVFYMCCLTWYTTDWSFQYAFASLEDGTANINTAAIIASIQVPITAMLTFVSKLYWEGKSNASNTN